MHRVNRGSLLRGHGTTVGIFMCGSRGEPLTRGPDPGGYFDIFIHTGLFFGFKILNFNIFGSFQKNEYFLDLN